MKIYIHNFDKGISKWLNQLLGATIVQMHESADLIVYPGGDDVNPNCYNEPAGQHTSFNKHDQSWETLFVRYAGKKKMLGICKGSQFLCAMAGGKLFQHVTNHAMLGTHDVVIEGEAYEVTSTHHQMMNPFVLPSSNYKILAHPLYPLSNVYLDGYDDNKPQPPLEPEAVLFGEGMLSIQFHPEFMSLNDPIQEIVKKWIENLMKTEIKKPAMEEEIPGSDPAKNPWADISQGYVPNYNVTTNAQGDTIYKVDTGTGWANNPIKLKRK